MESAADLQDMASLPLKFEFNPKLGIDNPVLSLAEDQDPSDLWSLERPRFCLLSKEEGKSFGFHVQQELGRARHAVSRVEPGTSAQRQGLREGDRILGVNNHIVEHEDSEVVVRRIRASGPRVLLTVLAKHVHDMVRVQQGNGARLCPTLGPGVRPRLCHIVKDEGGFGFSVTHKHQGSFWLVLSTGGAAERAGVPPGARLLEVNGVSVENFTHNQLSRKVRLSPLLFLESTEAPHSLQDTCLASLVETKDPPVENTAVPPVPCGSRQCFLYPGPGGGYGFQLSCVASGRCVFISQVTLGGSAARAGLQKGDVILEVNGYSVGGENDLERLQQLSETEPPLCLKLATRSPQGLEAWIPPGDGEDWAVASDLL